MLQSLSWSHVPVETKYALYCHVIPVCMSSKAQDFLYLRFLVRYVLQLPANRLDQSCSSLLYFNEIKPLDPCFLLYISISWPEFNIWYAYVAFGVLFIKYFLIMLTIANRPDRLIMANQRHLFIHILSIKSSPSVPCMSDTSCLPARF